MQIRLNYFDPKSIDTSTLSKQNESFVKKDYVAYVIKDIKDENGSYCFTDGCGLISLKLAQEVAERIGLVIEKKRCQ